VGKILFNALQQAREKSNNPRCMLSSGNRYDLGEAMSVFFRRHKIVLCIVFMFVLPAACGVPPSKPRQTFQWEWPADRTAEKFLLATVTSIEKQKTGLMGVNKSPSIADTLPDAHRITGTIIDGGKQFKKKYFSLLLPKVELGDVAVHDTVGLGIVENTICICISKVPDTAKGRDRQMQWLSSWRCQSG